MTFPVHTTRRSVPTSDLQAYWDCGWAYVMPDFDTPDHSIIEWLSDTAPRVPAENRVPETSTENANERRIRRA